MCEHLDLLILDSLPDKHAVMLARSRGNVAIGRLDLGASFVSLLNFKSAIENALLGKGQRPKKQDLAKFGKQLFDLLFAGDLSKLYARLPPGNISVHILSDASRAKSLPWEYMQDPTRPSGPQSERCIIRIIPTIGIDAPVPLPLKNKVRVLFCSADPINEPGVSWTDVKLTIERVYNAQIPDRFLFTAIEGGSRTSLLNTLQKERFDIFHFSGHCEIKGGVGHLVLVDSASGKSELLAADELAILLAGKGIRLAVLSACLTSAGNFADDFASVAGALIKAGIPAVVANQLSIPNKSVATFVGAMYRELLISGDIDLAVNAGRVALAISLGGIVGGDAVLEWGIPTLYRLFDANRIFVHEEDTASIHSSS